MVPLEDLAEEHGLGVEDVIELLHDFVEYTESENLPAMRQGLITRDHASVSNAAHSIKGAALNLRLLDIGSLARQIEEQSRTGDLAGIDELMNSLAELVKGLAGELSDHIMGG
jgi:HPt (histidine-containing phosphotransfer) domain-containing protein